MKSLYVAMVAFPLAILGACSQADNIVKRDAAPEETGGSSTPTGGSSNGGTGGASSTGGQGAGTGGATSGGTGGEAATGGTGATSTGGNSSGSGGTGTGGASTTGGRGGATTSTGGNGGSSSGTGGSSGGTVSVMDFAGIPNQYGESLMNSFIIMPCYGQAQQDCITIPSGQQCPAQNAAYEMQGLTQTESFTVGGTAGSMYNMTFTVGGISEAKYYSGGTRDAGNGPVTGAQDAAGTDTFYRGGMPVAVEHYNIYKMIVRKPDKTELAHYYLNSFPQTTTAYENHQTFPIRYTKTIPVPGGGSIDLYVSDSNCHAVDNCGPGVYAGTCNASRNIPGEPNLVIPTKYMGKNVSDINTLTGTKQPFHAQLIHITVTAIAAM